MPTKAMVFIDGSWLYHLIPQLRRVTNNWQFKIDYSKIPQLARREIAEQSGLSKENVVLARTNIYGALPIHIDAADQQDQDTQNAFYNTMSELYLFDTYVYEVSYTDPEGTHRLRAKDRREAGDPWNPKEKCVDMEMASSMMYYAALPGAYDVAVLVGGDRDYVPLLQNVRRLGKQVMVVGARNSTASVYLNAAHSPASIRDFETVLLDEHLEDLELKWEKKEHACAKCGKTFVTDFQPRRYQKVFCDDCRKDHKRQRDERATGDRNSEEFIENIGSFKRYQG